MSKLYLNIIIRPAFPDKKEILMEATVDETQFPDREVLARMLFQMEYVLNEHIPQLRFHSAITHNPEC